MVFISSSIQLSRSWWFEEKIVIWAMTKSRNKTKNIIKSLSELTAYERIKTIMKSAERKELFKEIEDPSEWQRTIRNEWERDFDNIR